MAKNFTVEWKGVKHVIPENEIFELADAVEDVVTIGELAEMGAKVKLTKIAAAYAAILRHVGVDVSGNEVWRYMLSDLGPKGPQARQSAILVALESLMGILTAGMPLATDGGEDAKKTTAS